MQFNPTRFLWAVGFAGIGLFAASRFGGFHQTAPAEPQVAPLLEQVQALGDLHAVKYTYRDVHEFQTTEEPSDWLAAVPGSVDVVHAATQNTALMSYTGAVEAGVDLSKAKIVRSSKGICVRLPDPKVYPPNVSAQVHDLHRGWIWHDISIVPSAIEDAKLRFRTASLKQGILDEAKKNVRARILTLSHGFSNLPVTISFGSVSVS